jgi:hypothetical protein
VEHTSLSGCHTLASNGREAFVFEVSFLDAPMLFGPVWPGPLPLEKSRSRYDKGVSIAYNASDKTMRAEQSDDVAEAEESKHDEIQHTAHSHHPYRKLA